MEPNTEQIVAALRASMVENERLRAEHQALADRDAEPIAIVGLACRYPGGVGSPEELWQLVRDGRDAVGPSAPGRGWPATGGSREGGFLLGAAEFDAGLFGIGPNEALVMDPQQRLLLEVSWEALERAGIDPLSLKGSRTGVYAGLMYHDYTLGASSDGSLVSGRVAYTFGFEGPALTVDTACSSSLVSLHLAVQALRAGECTLALAGGVTVMSTPHMFEYFTAQRGLASDGRCKSYSSTADGVGLAEGVGVLVLERLSEARRRGHRVWALVRGSAVNSDGASNGLTAPNGPSQQRVIRAALANARITAADVDVVEGHGTGTTLGDPIEAGALIATYGRERAGEPLWLGSLKSNIGHAQAASGVGGVIKMVMALRAGVMPPSRYADSPSEQVDWAGSGVRLLVEERAWPAGERPRRAAVSSFGLSGTNAHIVLEEAPAAEPATAQAAQAAPVVPWVLSGRTAEALAEVADRLAVLVAAPDVAVGAVGRSLAHRAALDRRVVLVGDRERLLAGLAEVAAGRVPGRAVRRAGRTALVLSGQGSQRLGMGRGLAQAYPAFRATFEQVIAAADQRLADLAGGGNRASVADVVWGQDEAALAQTVHTQVGLFAVQAGMVDLLTSWGVGIDLLIGHSVGEIAAAYAAGVLALPDAVELVTWRAWLMQQLPAGGAMLATALPEAQARAALAGSSTPEVGLAAVNGPAATVLSGPVDELDRVEKLLAEQGVRVSRLQVSHAFHSVLMEPILDRFGEALAGLTYRPAQIPIASTLTGGAGERMDADYWVRQLRQPVRFADAVSTAAGLGATRFLEAAPHPTLAPHIAATLDPADPVIAALQHRDQHPVTAALTALGQCYADGATVDWHTQFPAAAGIIDLPTYPFQHQRYWAAGIATGADVSDAGLAAVDHPLLGAVLDLPDTGAVVLTGQLTAERQSWLADHLVLGNVVLPGTAFVELATRAGRQVGCPLVEELLLHTALVLPESGAVQLQVSVAGPDAAGSRRLAIHSRPVAAGDPLPWTLHAEGVLAAGQPAGAGPDLTQWPPAGATPIELGDAYQQLAARGYGYGPAFQGLRAAWRRGDELFAQVALPEQARADAGRFSVHPALLDAAMHVMSVVEDDPAGDSTMLPFAWSGVSVRSGGASALRVRLSWVATNVARLDLADLSGSPVGAVEALSFRPVSVSQLAAAQPLETGSVFGVQWPSAELAAGRARTLRRWSAGLPIPAQPDEAVLLDCASAPAGGELSPADLSPAEAVRPVLTRLLADLQAWLAEGSDAPLVVLTRAAVATAGDDPIRPEQAAVWGMVRAAQAENPGRFVLLDADTDVDGATVAGVLAAGEPEAALRGGRLRVPRLARAAGTAADRPLLRPDRTVLVTGGTGGIGALIARRLVLAHGARRLLLVSRRGPEAPGAETLRAELAELGAEVVLAAADVGSRDDLRRVLDAVPAEHPVGAVVHVAGVVHNGLLGSWTPRLLEEVLAPKADAAWHLHELTRDLDLSAFILVSSAGGLVLAAGQAGYAAANVFLDALAEQRHREGLPALSMAWGAWALDTGMSAYLSEADLERMRRQGLPAFSAEEALEVFDAAVRTEAAVVVPVKLDLGRLRARADEIPALLRGLARVPGRPAAAVEAEPAGDSAVLRRLQAAAPADRRAELLTVIRTHAAVVLGVNDPEAIDPDRGFLDMGFDSLSALEMRNRMVAVMGRNLIPMLLFDYPSPAALAAYFEEEMFEKAPRGIDEDLVSLGVEELFDILDEELETPG